MQTFTQDAFVHALEQNISAARASKDATSRFIEVAERLVSSELVSTDALDFSSVLRDFFTEHDAPQLLSSAAAAAGAPVDADSIARSIVTSGAVGDALAEQAVSQLSVCPGPDASAALVRHVLAVSYPSFGSSPFSLAFPCP